MKTLILSSSLSEDSRFYLICKAVEKELLKKQIDIKIIDSRKLSINAYHLDHTIDKEILASDIRKCDNIIIGMGVHCYSINDNLKILLDNCFNHATGKLFGVICAAGGEKSYLATQHLTQICMNEWRMIQLPRIIYATKKDFTENDIFSDDLKSRITLFCNEFHLLGGKIIS